MQFHGFRFHDTSGFPIVRISGRSLPAGYGSQWVAEMESLLANGEPFVLIILDSAENPDHEDQKTLILWVKSNKKELSRICRGLVSIESDRTTRLLKQAQAAAMALAFGLRMKITPDLASAEALAARLLSGEASPETDGE